MTYAERVKEDIREIDKMWNETKNPAAVMRLHIIQDIREIDRKGFERIEEVADFDGSECIHPLLTPEEMEAKFHLVAALELMTKTWETICSIEDKFC